MLNPSTADAEIDDPTIKRCIQFAEREGCGELRVVNLFSFRSKDPEDLLKADDPVGPDADVYIDRMFHHDTKRTLIIAGWGAKPVRPFWYKNIHSQRVASILEKAYLAGHKIWSLGINKCGSPKHPLYIHSDAKLKILKPIKDDVS